jgi:glucose-6-phosphate isomerase
VGFPRLPFQTALIESVRKYAGKVRGGYDAVCLLRIGGSALDCAMCGPHPVQPAFSARNPRLVILDNVDPSFVEAALASGSTVETRATFLIVESWLGAAVGKKSPERIVAVTSEGHGDRAALVFTFGLIGTSGCESYAEKFKAY